MPMLRDANRFAMVVIFRSQVNADNGTGNILLAVNSDLILVGFMI